MTQTLYRTDTSIEHGPSLSSGEGYDTYVRTAKKDRKDNLDLYGSLDGKSEAPMQTDETAIEDLHPHIDQRKLKKSLSPDSQNEITAPELGEVQVNKQAVVRDVEAVDGAIGRELSDAGVDVSSETEAGNDVRKDIMTRVIGEQIEDGVLEDTDRLSNEHQRDVTNALVGQKFGEAIETRDPELFESLPFEVANKVAAQLWILHEKYGDTKSIPNDELAAVGALVTRLEKPSGAKEEETVVAQGEDGEQNIISLKELKLNIRGALLGDEAMLFDLKDEVRIEIAKWRAEMAADGKGSPETIIEERTDGYEELEREVGQRAGEIMEKHYGHL